MYIVLSFFTQKVAVYSSPFHPQLTAHLFFKNVEKFLILFISA